MAHDRRSLSLTSDGDEDESPWPAFGDIALALLLVFILFILAQFLHYDRLFVLETLSARQDSVRSGVLNALPVPQRETIVVETVDEYHQRLTFQAELLFASCDSRLTATGSQLVETVGRALKPYSSYFQSMQVEGHTDRRPPGATCRFEDNWALSSERAAAVVRLLAAPAVFDNAAILSAVGRGEFHSLSERAAGAAELDSLAEDRRIELVLQYTDTGIVR